MLQLKPEDLLSQSRLPRESYRQFKVRKRTLNNSLKQYLKNDVSNEHTTYMEYLRVYIAIEDVRYG